MRCHPFRDIFVLPICAFMSFIKFEAVPEPEESWFGPKADSESLGTAQSTRQSLRRIF